MNKLLQTTLISAILSGSAMASTTYFPMLIEDGATVYVNADTTINTFISNHGRIETESTSDYPTISGTGGINNFMYQSLDEVTDTTQKTDLATENPISGVTINKYYEIEESGGSVDENIILSGVSVRKMMAAYADLKGLTSSDLVILATNEDNRFIYVNGPETGEATTIACHFGDTVTGLSKTHELNLLGNLTFTGDLSNYKKGEINIGGYGDIGVTLSAPRALNVPVKVEAKSNIGSESSSCDIHSTVTVKDGTTLGFTGYVTLKSGAVLRLGKASM